MADGTTKPIDQVKVGDKITNSQPDSPVTQVDTVTVVHVTYTDHDYDQITVATPTGPKTITSTAEHLYWNTTTHTWTKADNLNPGDQLNTPGNSHTTILATKHYTALQTTYNLTINTTHTYYVTAGTTPVLVHNGTQCALPLITAANPSQSEVTAAMELAGRGSDVVLRDPIGTRAGGLTSDLLVNGEPWDVYTPTTGNVSRIVSAVASKGSQVQGGGVIIDLSQTSVTADQLANIQARIAGTGARIGQIVVMP